MAFSGIVWPRVIPSHQLAIRLIRGSPISNMKNQLGSRNLSFPSTSLPLSVSDRDPVSPSSAFLSLFLFFVFIRSLVRPTCVPGGPPWPEVGKGGFEDAAMLANQALSPDIGVFSSGKRCDSFNLNRTRKRKKNRRCSCLVRPRPGQDLHGPLTL